MSTDINAYMRANRRHGRLVRRIECTDGFSISVQAHDGAYCKPRADDNGHIYYYMVECGFPSGDVPELSEWKDGDGPDTKCVYGYVPIDVVAALIDSHGGIKP